jgi:hypothetical protein
MGSTSAARSALRARQNWLTRCRCASRRRTNWVPFTGKGTRHVRERSATRRRSKRSSHWSTQGHRWSDRNHRNWRSEWNHRNGRSGGNHRNGARQSHRDPSHVSEWSARRSARGCRGSANLACRCRVAVVAAGCHRRGHNVWAQCHSDPAQPSPSSNYSDVESIKDRHRHRLLHSSSGIPHSIDAAEPHAVPKSRLDDHVNYQQPTSPNSLRRTASFPNGDVRHGSMPVRHASVTQSRLL